jgi:hypothetical protein
VVSLRGEGGGGALCVFFGNLLSIWGLPTKVCVKGECYPNVRACALRGEGF